MIVDEELKKIIEEVIGNNDPYWNTIVYDIVKKIIDLPNGTITSIADLVNYNPKEKFIEPLQQGQISSFVKNTCKKINIQLERTDDNIGGLAYYNQFKKIDNTIEEKTLENNSVIFNDNLYVINDEKITITKKEYDELKYCQEDLYSIEDFIAPKNDFSLKIFKGAVIPKTHPNYYNNRISIEINSLNDYKIRIEKMSYILTEKKYEIIKNIIEKELNKLIDIAKQEDYNYLLNYGYEGGTSSTIIVKFNGLIIHLNGQVSGNIGEFCNLFIEKIKEIIIDNAEEDRKTKILEMMNNMPEQPKTQLDEEFDKYCKLYEERFNKRAYIPEPSGTKEFAIECIKKCLDENKDILDELYYPNFKKDMENGVLYSETKQNLNEDNQNLNTIDDDRKTIDFLCNNCNTTTSMSFRKKFTTGNKVFARCNNCGNQISVDNPFNKENINTNDKFVWKEGEIKIAKTQCEFCKYNDKEHSNVCSQYPNGKPSEVINNSVKCPKYDREHLIDL